MAKRTKVEELGMALRFASVSLVTAAIILRQRDAAIWTGFAEDAVKAHEAASQGESPWWASEMFPRSDVAVSP